jgi:hypothetical protein
MLRDGVDRGSPLWLGALQMAEAWGVPPWEIMDAPGSLMWAARWAAYRKEVRWVEENKK